MIKLLRNIFLSLISIVFLLGSGGIYFVVHHCSGSGETSIHFLQKNGCCGEVRNRSVCHSTNPFKAQHQTEALSKHSCCSNIATFLITDKHVRPSIQESPLILDCHLLNNLSFTTVSIAPPITVIPNHLYSQGPPITYDFSTLLSVFRI